MGLIWDDSFMGMNLDGLSETEFSLNSVSRQAELIGALYTAIVGPQEH
jgi:hypothetical protein